jgi:hypothetical protein
VKFKEANYRGIFFKHRLRKKEVYVLLLCFTMICYSVVIFTFGAWTYRSEYLQPIVRSLYWKVANVDNYLKSIFTSPPIKLLKIHINHKNYQRLAYDRELALNKGRLFGNEYVPARIEYEGSDYKIKMRLKGDALDHIKSLDKWSFRIKIGDKKTIFGMKRFSLQSPETRNYMYEFLYHSLLKYEDILSLRYDFVRIHLNGKNLGIYALEEHFDKILIESNQHREGVILKFNENIFWEDNIQNKSRSNGLHMESASNIEPFRANTIFKNETLKKQFIIARDLLELFRRGDLRTHQVFNIDKLARFFVLSEMTKTAHGAFIWGNLRFYYNPITSLLEPIGFDGQTGNEEIVSMWSTKRMQEIPKYASDVLFYHEIFKDMLFFEKYIYYIEKYTKPKYLELFFENKYASLQNNLDILYSEYPQIDDVEKMKSRFKETQIAMRNLINPVKGIHAYVENATDTEIEISFGNIQIMPIEILYIMSSSDEIYYSDKKIIIPPKLSNSPVDFIPYKFQISKQENLKDLKVIYKILGTSVQQLKTSSVYPYPHFSKSHLKDDLIRPSANLSEFDFFQIDSAAKIITIKPGNWIITQDVIIPKGYIVHARESVQITLSNGSSILSYSPIHFEGTEEIPVLITSDDNGEGIVVIGAQERSILRFVVFDNLSSPLNGDWSLSGSVTFYESPVSLSFVRFVKSRSEDSLNIIRSNFSIDNSEFTDSVSDSFDGDFVSGKISNTTFNNCGNDCIDISGSSLNIEKSSLSIVGDKGVSAGEGSTVYISNTSIDNSEIAVASKDQSTVFISDSKIFNSKVAYAAFQKKQEYGPSIIVSNQVEIKGYDIPYLVEGESSIQVDDVFVDPVESTEKIVKDYLYGTKFGKSSNK